MPSWPAPASGECLFYALKYAFIRPRNARINALLQQNPTLQRDLSQGRRRPHESPTPVDDKRGRRLGLLSVKKDNGEGFIPTQRFKIDKRAKENENERGIRLIAQSEQVRAAVLQQLRDLKNRLERETVKDGSYLATVAALDPSQARWRAFEAEIRLLLKEGTKTNQARNRTLSPGQWNFYRKLYQAQLPPGTTMVLPRAEVRSLLEYTYYDSVIQSDKETQTNVYDPVAEYTDLRYPTEWYAAARSTQRQIHLHVGPTNSGKTYTALKRLEEAGNGYYCGPLRLLAHEVYARFQAKGIPCHLITGDDVRTDPSEDAKLRSSTVEMVDTNSRVEVAVIDEIQMIAHEERGWAWTRAFLGSNAKEVHLCGETRVVPLIRELAASMGDTLHIHSYERLSPLKVMSKSLRGNLKLLRKGDCVVSFSVLGIHALKKEIEKETGRRVAIVYGSLPPETRAKQAELFNDPDNDYDYLVASDAIGMGLNLAVKRMIFESVYKYNGRERELLTIPQIKQIAGRAGRYRTAKQGNDKETKEGETKSSAPQAVGLVTCMEDDDLHIIRKALDTEPEPLKTAGLLPPSEFVEEYAARLPKGLPFEYIFQRLCDVAKIHRRFKLVDTRSQLRIAKTLDAVPRLTITDRLVFSASPAETRKPIEAYLLIALAKCVSEGKHVSCADIPEMPLEMLDEPMSGQREYLQGLELLHKALILYLWLSYRFVGIFKDQAQAMYAKSLTEERINETLSKFSHSAELKERMRQLKSRQIRDSSIISELDPGLSGEPLDVLLNDNEPSTEMEGLIADAEGQIDDTGLTQSGEGPRAQAAPFRRFDLAISPKAQDLQLLYKTGPLIAGKGAMGTAHQDSRPRAAESSL